MKKMDQTLHKRHPAVLWILIGVAVAFNLLVHFRPDLTGNDHVNGYASVALGLFTAAFPAANFLDMLLAELGSLRWQAIKRADLPCGLEPGGPVHRPGYCSGRDETVLPTLGARVGSGCPR